LRNATTTRVAPRRASNQSVGTDVVCFCFRVAPRFIAAVVARAGVATRAYLTPHVLPYRPSLNETLLSISTP
jgi:hypothetical protein